MGTSILEDKSYSFAIRVVVIVKTLQVERKEYVLSRQLLHSGTAIGALVSEAEFGQSKMDFAHKLSIALKEANESRYWLNLLKETDYFGLDSFNDIENDCTEIIRILVSSIKTSKLIK
jgi:four helix bundle protein